MQHYFVAIWAIWSGTAQQRPDAFISLDSKRGQPWTCLVEAKIGRAELEQEKLIQYAALADSDFQAAILQM